MPAEEINSIVTPALIGGGAGLWGGIISALVSSTSPRQTFVAVMGGMSLGAFLPALAMWAWSIPPALAGTIGLFSGLGVYSIIQGIQKLASRFGTNPEQFVQKYNPIQLPPKPPEDRIPK